ncbi:MAG: VWA domain-containing protein [Deltaproteobacteria bacterium]|nr:VWA domain-containing protein [Deltaproteobacteria bacterium]
MTFAAPAFLALGAALAVAVVLLARAARRHRATMLRRFAATRLVAALTASASPARRAVKTALLAVGALLLCAALARPQLGATWEEARQRGIDLLFAVDTSKSMLAGDVKPDRLTRAKLAIHDLVTRFPADRVGLVAFAGDAFLSVPLTLDRGVFESALMGLEPGVIPRGGSDLARAIGVSREALANEPGNEKLLIMLTDGEDLGGEAVAAAKEAAEDGVTIHAIGVGSASGELVPDPDGRGAGAVVRDADGKPVVSKLDEDTLRAVAAATGGRYEALGADGGGLERLYEGTLAELPKRLLESRRTRVPIERFQWPLAAALLCFFAEGLVGDRRRAARVVRGARAAASVAAAVLLAVIGLGGGARAATPEDALNAYRLHAYDAAAGLWGQALAERPGDPKLLYDRGAAAYKAGRWDDAVTALEGATVGRSVFVGPKGAYNLGNAYFRKGEDVLRGGDREATKAVWQKAVGAYEQALAMAPGDADAEHNLEVVKRRLAALEEPPKQDQKQDDQDQKDQKDQDQDQKGQQGQDPKDQQGQDEKDKQGQQGQDEKDKQGQQDSKDQQGHDPKDQQGHDPKDQQGAKDQQAPKDQPGQDAKAEPQPGSAPGASGGEPDADHVRPAPGQLNRAEARALLDAHERGRPIPALPLSRGAQDPEPRPTTKDW